MASSRKRFAMRGTPISKRSKSARVDLQQHVYVITGRATDFGRLEEPSDEHTIAIFWISVIININLKITSIKRTT
jgi:hypothetical protein